MPDPLETPPAPPSDAQPNAQTEGPGTQAGAGGQGSGLPATPDKKPEPKAPEADRLAELEKQTKRAAWEGMERAKKLKREKEEVEKSRAAHGKDLEEIAAYKREREDRRRNPAKYLAAEYGADWYDKLSKVRLDGAPTPDLIASEVDDKFAAAEKGWEEKFKALEKRYEERETQSAAREKQAYEARAVDYVKANAEKFPLIHAFEVADNITGVIEYHFHETAKQDEDGNWTPGEVWTPEQAAAEMEKALTAKVEAADKARAAVKAKTQAQNPTTHRSETPQRRSLSTDLGGTSRQDRPPPMTEADRMKRAMAAIDALGTTQPN